MNKINRLRESFTNGNTLKQMSIHTPKYTLIRLDVLFTISPFSPTSPVGFTIKKNSNINILIASDKSGIKYAVKAPANPTIKEAIAEPCTLPNPPIITTIKLKLHTACPSRRK